MLTRYGDLAAKNVYINQNLSKVLLEEGLPKFKFSDNIGSGNYSKTKAFAHADFGNAIKELNIHAALLSGYIKVPTGYENPLSYFMSMMKSGEKELLETINATGFEDNKGIVIYASIQLHCRIPESEEGEPAPKPMGLKEMGFCTPAQNPEGDEYPYPFGNELAEAVEEIKAEALEYLSGAKTGYVQAEINFGDEEGENTFVSNRKDLAPGSGSKKQGRPKKDKEATDESQN